MKKKFTITKEDSACLYGIAILLMLYHHLYGLPERLNCNYIPLLQFSHLNLEKYIAWFGKICVAIYAFMSGYGLFFSARKNNLVKLPLIKADYKIAANHLFRFYRKYWIVFCVFVPYRFIVLKKSFDLSEFLLAFWGLSGLQCTYNYEWWYVATYIKLLLVFPLMDAVFIDITDNIQEKKIFVILFKFVVFVLAAVFVRYWILVFVAGYVFAQYNLFAKLDILQEVSSEILQKMLAAFGILVIFFVRSYFAKSNSFYRLDVILVPFFVYFFIYIVRGHCKIFKLFGKYSTYMWLTHTFFAYYYFQSIVLLPRVSLLIYLWLIILSLLAAIVLERFEKILLKFSKSRLNKQK